MRRSFCNSMARKPGTRGRMDSFDWLRTASKSEGCIELSGIEELKGFARRPTESKSEPYQLTEVVQIRHSTEIWSVSTSGGTGRFSADSQQGRSAATSAGRSLLVYRADGPAIAPRNICYADTPVGRNREHAILHAERCVAVNPSDTARPSSRSMPIRRPNPKGQQVIDAENYFVGPTSTSHG